MNELLVELQPHLISLAVALLTAIGSWLMVKVKALLDTQQKKDIVEATVKYVNQVAYELGGAEKLALAKAKALEWANSKGLKISEVELEILIESFVGQFRKEIE